MTPEEILKLPAVDRIKYYESVRQRDSRVQTAVEQQLSKPPESKTERDLQFLLTRRDQKNADRLRRTPYTGYDSKIAELENLIQQEAEQKAFASSSKCQTCLEIFDQQVDSVLERLSPEQQESLEVQRLAFIQAATGDSKSLYSSITEIQTAFDVADAKRKHDLTTEALTLTRDAAVKREQAAEIRVDDGLTGGDAA